MKVILSLLLLNFSAIAFSQDGTVLEVATTKPQQRFDGMGCGTIFYSGHITSFGKRNKNDLQARFYDEVFRDVSTQYLHIMIRPDFEPENDNDDPYTAEFIEEDFEKNLSALEVCRQARKRNPDMKLFATLYTPPAWMKTNGKESGGGDEKGTLRQGLALEMGEYIWGYLKHMQVNGEPVHYLSICNEADWAHDQPSYWLTPKRHGELFEVVAEYLDEMEQRFPEVPRPQLVGPNMLSAVSTAKKYWPAMSDKAKSQTDVLAAHDYDRRGDRWRELAKLAEDRPLWCSEWCWNGKDESPDLINACSEFWLVMTEAFNGGANVWMAYDWAYPPRQGGEALTHIEWGQSYHKTKIYYGFQQWCNALKPGMRVVETNVEGAGASGFSQPGVKTSAFMDTTTGDLVVHVVNLQQKKAALTLRLDDPAYAGAKVRVHRTSEVDSNKVYPEKVYSPEGMLDTLKAREMVTYVLSK